MLQEILERYSNREDVMNQSWHLWVTFLETCHLLGIVNYIFSDALDEKVEVVNFHNVTANYEQDAFAEYFRLTVSDLLASYFFGNHDAETL